MSAESSPKIVIVDESPIRAAILEEGLREAGFTGVVHISEMQSLLARIYALDPDNLAASIVTPKAWPRGQEFSFWHSEPNPNDSPFQIGRAHV